MRSASHWLCIRMFARVCVCGLCHLRALRSCLDAASVRVAVVYVGLVWLAAVRMVDAMVARVSAACMPVTQICERFEPNTFDLLMQKSTARFAFWLMWWVKRSTRSNPSNFFLPPHSSLCFFVPSLSLSSPLSLHSTLFSLLTSLCPIPQNVSLFLSLETKTNTLVKLPIE